MTLFDIYIWMGIGAFCGSIFGYMIGYGVGVKSTVRRLSRNIPWL